MEGVGWSKEEDVAFEHALADFGKDWEKIAAAVPMKTVEEIRHHYDLLVEDVTNIIAGRVPLPNYVYTNRGGSCNGGNVGGSYNGGKRILDRSDDCRDNGGKCVLESRKGVPWTSEEHRLFLLGLETFGKGDWRSISRNCVKTRTPTQVASHAQKYYNRVNSKSARRDRRRISIHDITVSGDGDELAREVSTAVSSHGITMRNTIQQPVGGPVIAAGNTLILPAPDMADPVCSRVSSTVLHGASVNPQPDTGKQYYALWSPCEPDLTPETYVMPSVNRR